MNLIIDTSYIARKNAWIKSSGPDCFSEYEERELLRQSLLTSVDYIAKKYNKIDRIIFAFDSFFDKSWRYSLLYQDIYKSNRKPSNRYNLLGFKIALQEFYDDLNKNGLCTLMYNSAEGDDLIYLSSNLLYNANESSIIVTADNDMTQLIKNDNKNYIFIFNNDSKKNIHLVDKIAAKNDHTVLSMEDFFDIDQESTNKEIIYERCVSVIPELSLFLKILSGDKSDTIPSCYFYQKGSKQFGFTELRAQSVFDKYYSLDFMNKNLSIELIFNSDSELKLLAERIITEVGKTPDQLSIEDCIVRLKTNKQYIHLDYHSYPIALYDNMEKYVIDQLSKNCSNSVKHLIKTEE